MDRVQTGGAELTIIQPLLTLQPDDHVVEVREQFVRHQIDVRESADGRAQVAHGGGGVQAVADDIAHDERQAGSGQRSRRTHHRPRPRGSRWARSGAAARSRKNWTSPRVFPRACRGRSMTEWNPGTPGGTSPSAAGVQHAGAGDVVTWRSRGCTVLRTLAGFAAKACVRPVTTGVPVVGGQRCDAAQLSMLHRHGE